jgi:hypothetical protein
MQKLVGYKKKAYNLTKKLGRESEYINLFYNFILSIEVSLSEVGYKENTDEIQKKNYKSNFIKPRGNCLKKDTKVL